MKRKVVFVLAWGLLLVSVYFAMTALNGKELWLAAQRLLQHGWLLLVMAVCYAAAFWLRSAGWAMQMGQAGSNKATVEQLWLYHHIGLFLNHVLPIKGGELARAALLKTRHQLDWGTSLYSVGVSRLLDMSALMAIAALTILWVAPHLFAAWVGEKAVWFWLLSPLALIGVYLVTRLAKRRQDKLPDMLKRLLAQTENGQRWWLAFGCTLLGWVLEAAVIGSVVFGLGGNLDVAQALLIHVLTIMGQTLHVTPGGIGTYEAVMSTLLVQVAGYTLAFGLQAAILSHGFKFLYSFVMGGYAAWRLSLSPLRLYRQAKEEGERRSR